MLIIPSKGFSRSVTTSNIHPEILCDWIEASVLFRHEELSIIDVVDFLVDAGICDDPDEDERFDYIYEGDLYMDQEQHLARQIVQDAWLELERRANWIGSECAYNIQSDWIRRKGPWEEHSAQAFCVLLSLATSYDWWIKEFGRDYSEQGELFELISQESLQTQFSDWKIYQTGWTRNNAVGLRQVIHDVSNLLGEKVGELELWDDPNAKELGLDLLCYRPFPDNRVGIQVYLAQCASGHNWKNKRHTPDINVWCKVVEFTGHPKRAFIIPFSLLNDEFARSTILVDGLLIDRCRLLNASRHRQDWVSNHLKSQINQWLQLRVDVLLAKSR